MKIICLIVDLFFLLAMGACAIGLIICAVKLFILNVDDWKEVNKKHFDIK